MKIVSSGKTISTSEYYQRRVKARRQKLIIIFSIILLFLGFLTFLSRQKSLRIQHVSVSGATAISKDDVTAVVKDFLKGNYFWLIPKDNALLYPEDKLEEKLKEEFPRFSSLTVSLDGLETLVVEVSERKPFALYCAGGETCLFLDEEGYLFDYAPSFSEGVYFTYQTEGEPLVLGESLLPQSEFKELTQFLESLPELGITPSELILKKEDLVLSLESGAIILWPKESKLSHIYSNLDSFLNSEAIKSQKDFLEKVRELDLRTENKVFYKF